MSADNGIYILETLDQYRVVHTQAIDNLTWSFENLSCDNDLVPTRIVEYYGNCKPIKNESEVRRIAFEMAKTIIYLEYGIHTITVDKTWEEINENAKKHAKIEIESIKENPRSFAIWGHKISELEKIIRGKYI